jgi:hypothetical protein
VVKAAKAGRARGETAAGTFAFFKDCDAVTGLHQGACADGLRAYPDFGTIDTQTIGWSEVNFYRFFDHVLRMGQCDGWSDEWILEDKSAIDAQRAPTAPRAASRVVQRLLESEEYHAWRAFQKKEWREEKQARLEPIKEELIASAWYPDRMMDWCVDWEELRDMCARWAPAPPA